MIKLIATTDLHQHPAKWKLLVAAIAEQKPNIVLIAGDILPKYDGFLKQREFFPELHRLLTEVRDEVGSQVLLYLCNDDAHDKPLRQAFKRGLLDDLVASGKVTFVGDPDPHFQTGMHVVIENQRIVLAHYAQRTWQGAFRGAWHLYGHSHGNLPPFRKSLDVGIDAWDFRPVSFEEIRERMDAVTEEFSEN